MGCDQDHPRRHRARAAGCSRATVYRAFPGGKDVLLHEAATHEILAFFAEVAADVDAASDLADALTRALLDATRRLRRHEALQYLVAHEPGMILPYTSFDGIQPLLDLAAATVYRCSSGTFPTSSAPQRVAELSEWLVHRAGVRLDVDDEGRRRPDRPAHPALRDHLRRARRRRPDNPGPDRTQP
ncbi:MAG: hypothetical protein R2699_10275 [Acidimicrobiales bacterium]